jgi:acetate kinase
MVCDGLEHLGIKIDLKLNECKGEERKISSSDSKVEVWVVPTNEELMIARETLRVLNKLKSERR